jgi:hypothetical protein
MEIYTGTGKRTDYNKVYVLLFPDIGTHEGQAEDDNINAG